MCGGWAKCGVMGMDVLVSFGQAVVAQQACSNNRGSRKMFPNAQKLVLPGGS